MPARRYLGRLALLGLFALALGVSLCAAQQAREQEPVLRRITRLVRVSVVAHDKNGQPVEGLTREDFTLFDEGEAQPIGLFSVEASRAQAVERGLPPNTFSNRIGSWVVGVKSPTVILLDFLNTRWSERAYARQQVIKFLQQLEPGDRVAICALATELRVLHDFTSDSRALLRALDHSGGAATTHAEASLARQAEPAEGPMPGGLGEHQDFESLLNEQFQQMADFYVRDRIRRTADAMVALAGHLSGFPGRKSVVWVSSAFPFSLRTEGLFDREIERAARAMNEANIALYPVDARGLDVAMQPPLGAVHGSVLRRGPPPPLINTAELTLAHFTMTALASDTGGQAFYNTNDIGGAIRRVLDDSKVTYTLGYYPTHNRWNGTFRRIRVATKRKDVRLRYRAGYLAVPPEPAPASLQEQRMRLLAEAQRPLLSTALEMTVQADLATTSGAKAVDLQVRLAAADLTLSEINGKKFATVELLFVQTDDKGSHLHNVGDTFRIGFTPQALSAAARNGVVIHKTLKLQPGAQGLVVVAGDVPSGTLGSVSVPLAELDAEAVQPPNPR